jgi:hypothetical protein
MILRFPDYVLSNLMLKAEESQIDREVKVVKTGGIKWLKSNSTLLENQWDGA